MKRLFAIFGGLVVVVLIVGVAGVAVIPGRVEAVRMARIEAPVGEVFGRVNRLQEWEAWQPWLTRDATLEIGYEGEEAGVGARSVWTSEESGSGAQEIVESVPGERIVMALDFEEMGAASSSWTFVEKDGTTVVTWSMTVELRGMAKFFWAAVRKSVESDYEEGLANLKVLVEGRDGNGRGVLVEGGLAEDAAGEGEGGGEGDEGDGVGSDGVIESKGEGG